MESENNLEENEIIMTLAQMESENEAVMALTPKKFGMPFKLEEMVCLPLLANTVKVAGWLVEYDPGTHRALLGAPYLKNRLPVDMSQIEPFSGKVGSLYQVIGDIQDFTDSTKPRLLMASLIRCVDGLDVFEYSRAIDRQRRHFLWREEYMQIGSVSNDPPPVKPEKENPLDPDGLDKMPPHLRNISTVDDFVRLCLEDENYSDLEEGSGDLCDPYGYDTEISAFTGRKD